MALLLPAALLADDVSQYERDFAGILAVDQDPDAAMRAIGLSDAGAKALIAYAGKEVAALNGLAHTQAVELCAVEAKSAALADKVVDNGRAYQARRAETVGGLAKVLGEKDLAAFHAWTAGFNIHLDTSAPKPEDLIRSGALKADVVKARACGGAQ